MSEEYNVLETLDLLAALKLHLAAIDHPTSGAAKLFEVVEYHEDKNLAEALTELLIVKSRVCLIVPSGDRYDNAKEGRSVRSTVTTSLDLIMADRAYVKGGQDAAFSGPNNVGVIKMKGLVVKSLAQNPQLGLKWCALRPTDGAFLSLSEDQAKSLPGRQAFIVNYDTPAGWFRTPLTAEWPA